MVQLLQNVTEYNLYQNKLTPHYLIIFFHYPYFILGEVPNLFESEEYEKVINAIRSQAKSSGVDETNRDAIFDFFISRVRSKLHLVLCMSPIGDSFRYFCYQ